jgi:FMN phosphatase YigB (HAD superfamily)
VERLGLDVRDILFVGDHLKMDIAGAQAVGMPAAWLNRSGSVLTDSVKPDYQLTSLSDLLQITPFKV